MMMQDDKEEDEEEEKECKEEEGGDKKEEKGDEKKESKCRKPAPLPENWERQVTKMVICTFSTPRRSQHCGRPCGRPRCEKK